MTKRDFKSPSLLGEGDLGDEAEFIKQTQGIRLNDSLRHASEQLLPVLVKIMKIQTTI